METIPAEIKFNIALFSKDYKVMGNLLLYFEDLREYIKKYEEYAEKLKTQILVKVEDINFEHEKTVYYTFPNMKKHGELIKYHPNGRYFIQRFYKDEKLEGEYKVWWNNGNLHLKSFYKNGMVEGRLEIRDREGILIKTY